MRMTSVTTAAFSVFMMTALAACMAPGDVGESRDAADSGRTGGRSTVSPGGSRHPDGSPHLDTTSGIMAPQHLTGNARIDSAAAQMRSLEALSPTQVQARLPAYRQGVANMLSEMNSGVRRMQIPSVPAWTAVRDSVRRDLARLPRLTAEELRDAMPAYDARVLRLMQMHADLMKRRTTAGRP